MKPKSLVKVECPVCKATIEVHSDMPSFVVAGLKRFEKQHEKCKKVKK